MLGGARGFTEREVAAALGLTIHQVQNASRSAVAKLGAMNKAHAIVRAIADGYLEVSTEDRDAIVAGR